LSDPVDPRAEGDQPRVTDDPARGEGEWAQGEGDQARGEDEQARGEDEQARVADQGAAAADGWGAWASQLRDAGTDDAGRWFEDEEPDRWPPVPGPRPDAAGPAGYGPPGGRIFSLEGRRAPGLYLVAWLLIVGGFGLLIIASLASSDLGRAVLVILFAIAWLLGWAAAAGYQIVERRDRPARLYRGPAPVIVFIVVLAVSSIVSALLLGSGLLDPVRPAGFLATLLLTAAVYALTVWLFAVRSGALRWRDMGWPVRTAGWPRRLLRDVGYAAAVMLPATLGILVFGGVLATLLGVEAPDVLPAPDTSADALMVALAAAVVAPVGEELFFRGFALTAWLRDLGSRSAILRSAVFFAAIHVLNITTSNFAEGAGQAVLQTAVILPVGLLLGWLFVRHGMAGAITGHVTYNTFLLFLLLLSTVLPPTA
jgi:hypothetical protein